MIRLFAVSVEPIRVHRGQNHVSSATMEQKAVVQTDEQLLSRFLRGEREALGELARRYELPLLGLCAGMLGGRRDRALDAVQETWMRVIRYGHTFSGRCSLKTWL